MTRTSKGVNWFSPKLSLLWLLFATLFAATSQYNRVQKNQRDKVARVALDDIEREQNELAREMTKDEKELTKLEKLGNVAIKDLDRLRLRNRERGVRSQRIRVGLEQIKVQLGCK